MESQLSSCGRWSRWRMPKGAFTCSVYLPLLASHICFEQSRPPSHAKLQQITTLWWSGRWRLSQLVTELPRQGYQRQRKEPTIPLCAKIRPTWDTRPYGKPTCQSEKAALDLLAAAPSKVRHISAATPWSWGVSSLPSPGVTFHSLWNGCLSDPWRQRSLKS